MRNLIANTDVYTEKELTFLLAKLSNKTVVHLKCVGLLEDQTRANDVWEFYSDKTPLPVLNALINSDSNTREAYVFLNNYDEMQEAYTHWFPMEGELHDDERHLYVKMFIVSPAGEYVLTNERQQS